MKIFCSLLIVVISLGSVCAQVFTNYTSADGLASNGVNCVTVDADDNILFGTNAGVSIFDGVSSWETLSKSDGTGLVDDVITAIHMTEFGVLWVGTDFGICRYDGSEWRCFTDELDIGNKRIQAITAGNQGDLFFGTRSGYTRLDPVGNWSTFGMSEGLPFGGVKDIKVDERGKIWMALGLGGVATFEPGPDVLIKYTEDDLLVSNSCTGVFVDNERDEVWISSGAGLDKFKDVTGTIVVDQFTDVFELPPPHTLNQLVDIEIDSEGRAWGGVFIDYLVNVGGITFLENEVWTTLDVDDGLIGPVVMQLAIDSQDNIWVATSSGVSKYGSEVSAVEDLIENSFMIFPNPVMDYLTVSLESSSLKSNESVMVEIYNSGMQMVQRSALPMGQATGRIEVSGLMEGLYLVKLGDSIQKIIKL